MRKLNTAEVVEQFKKKHEERYDYGRVDYKDSHTKVIIICKKHGEFSQTPSDHKQGKGCPSCSGTKQLNTAEVVEQFKKKHEERYDYGRVDYKDAHTKVIIICKKHGEFSQTPNDHKQGKGCPSCSGTKQLNTAEVVEQFKKKHEERYDYGRVDYKNSQTKVIIICKEHGEFSQTPKDHKQGKGCPKCASHIASNASSLASLIELFYPSLHITERHLGNDYEINVFHTDKEILDIYVLGFYSHQKERFIPNTNPVPSTTYNKLYITNNRYHCYDFINDTFKQIVEKLTQKGFRHTFT